MTEEEKKEEKIPTPEELEAKIEEVVEEEVEEEVVVENYEEQASVKGWRPEEEYTGDTPWVPAKEFILRQPLFDAIHKLSKKNKDLTMTVDNLVDHNRKMKEVTRKQVIEELKLQKVAALESGDNAAVVEIDDRIDDAKREPEQAPVQSAEFINFVEKNSWYDEKPNMKRYATRVGYEFLDKNPTATETQVFSHVEEVIKDAYPEEFAPPPNPKRKAASAVAAPKGSPATKSKAKLTKEDLSFEERSVMNNMLRNSPLKEDEYLEQYALVLNEEN